MCRSDWPLPKEGINALPKNYVAISFRDGVQPVSECVLADNGMTHGQAEYFCIDCWDAMCETCCNVHRMTKYTKGHALKRVKEVNRDDVDQHRKKVATKCAFHSNQDVVVYCSTCKEIACTICCVTKHSKHDCVELAVANEKFVEAIKNSLQTCVNYELSLNAEKMQLKEAYEDLKRKRMAASERIKSTTAELRQKMLSACDVMMQRIDDVENEAIVRTENHLEDEFVAEFKTITLYESMMASHKILCETLLSSSSTIMDRAAQIDAMTPLFQRAFTNQLLQQNIDEQINKMVATTQYKFIFKANPNLKTTLPSLKFQRRFDLPSEFTVKFRFAFNNDNEQSDKKIQCLYAFKNMILCVREKCINIIEINNENVDNKSFPISAENAIFTMDGTNIITSSLSLGTTSIVSFSGFNKGKPTLVSQSGGFYVVGDKNILLAANNSIYNSSNDGQSWDCIFVLPTTGAQCLKVVQVQEMRSSDHSPATSDHSPATSDHSPATSYHSPATSDQSPATYGFWIIERIPYGTEFNFATPAVSLNSYSSFASSSNGRLSSLNKTLIDNTSRVSVLSQLAYDGSDVVMMSDYHNHTIHMYSVCKKQYLGILPLPSPMDVQHPSCLHFDIDGNVLYVALKDRQCIEAYSYKRISRKDYQCFNIHIEI